MTDMTTEDETPVLDLLARMTADSLDASSLDPEKLRGVLAAVAPIVGTARVAAATGNIVKALAVEIEVAELDSQDEG